MSFVIGSGFDASDLDKSMLIREAIEHCRTGATYKSAAYLIWQRWYRDDVIENGPKHENQIKQLATKIRKLNAEY